jgi:anthranilate phosphoribosyltransferase
VKVEYQQNQAPTEIQRCIQDLILHHKKLSEEEAGRIFQVILNGGATPPQTASILTALAMRGETTDELLGAVKALRAKTKAFEIPEAVRDRLVDVCGSGGDKRFTLNISSTVGLVVAACGVYVAKHGNRAVSSKSGSADVFSALGINLEASDDKLLKCLREAYFCFLMAPKFHFSMQHVMPIRRELGVRTIFNVLGPLINPLKPKRQLIGVFDKRWLLPIANVLKSLGTVKAWVVSSDDGMDEISLSAPTQVVELNNGVIRSFTINPQDYGFELLDNDALITGDDAVYNATAMRKILHNQHFSANIIASGPESQIRNAYLDIVLLNSAAALVVADKVATIGEGVALARQAIESGKTRTVLDKIIEITNS